MTAFATTLKELRKERGITIVDLSEKIGYSKSIISYWENGIKEPTLSALETLAHYFGLTISELVGEKEIRGASGLTNEEWRLIDEFREISGESKELLFSLLKTWKQKPSNTTAKHKIS